MPEACLLIVQRFKNSVTVGSPPPLCAALPVSRLPVNYACLGDWDGHVVGTEVVAAINCPHIVQTVMILPIYMLRQYLARNGPRNVLINSTAVLLQSLSADLHFAGLGAHMLVHWRKCSEHIYIQMTMNPRGCSRMLLL